MRCCVLGEITLNVQCPQLSDSRFGVYCHAKATGGVSWNVPKPKTTYCKSNRIRCARYLIVTAWFKWYLCKCKSADDDIDRRWKNWMKLLTSAVFKNRTVSYSPWVKEVREAILRRLWWGGCQGWNRRTSWLRPSSPEMQKHANRAKSLGPVLCRANSRHFHINVIRFFPLFLGIFTLISGVFCVFDELIFPRQKFHLC